MLAVFIETKESDLERLVDTRIAAMRESLERAGRFDLQRARERFTASFRPEDCFHIMVEGVAVGFFSLVRRHDAYVLRHLYILPTQQRQGTGAQVLQRIVAAASRTGLPVHLSALRGSDANRFYQRHGFVQAGEEEWDINYTRAPGAAAPSLAGSEIGIIRWLVGTDLPHLDVVLRQHVRDLHTSKVVNAEIAAIKACMTGAADDDGRYRSYLVACDLVGTPVACMGLGRLDVRMGQHLALSAPGALELLNVFVRRDFMRTRGIGRSLLSAVCGEAMAAGATRLLVNSGPRYRASWGFYDRMFDAEHGMLPDYYGAGRHAKVWSKLLDSGR